MEYRVKIKKDEHIFKDHFNGFDIIKKTGQSEEKDIIAIMIDGIPSDLSIAIDKDCKVEFIRQDSKEGLNIIRHDAAHILAQALTEIYPNCKITIGPVIENGFYYDVLNNTQISESDFEIIEQKMHEIVDRDYEIEREILSKQDAKKLFKKNEFKVEIIEDLPEDVDVSIYKQGEFKDLCKGPHLPRTKDLGHAFKLTKIAGAYWRGDSKREMLQRIYGTAFLDQKSLDKHLLFLKEAAQRDHRKLGQTMDLFHLREEARGSIFWHKNGEALYYTIEKYMRAKLDKHEYQNVKTPIIATKDLWVKSGHWDKFKENMFITESDDSENAIKPMNCPCHLQIFKTGSKSYRDLPIRMSEFGICHRNEPSGSLHGLMRVRGFTQDDAHIFCTKEQMDDEILNFCTMLKEVYNDFGFFDISIKFSDRPKKRIGSDDLWDSAEDALKKAAIKAKIKYAINKGEGAFYGPKLEFVLKDAIGRSWQCGTIQVDFFLPSRLDASYKGYDDKKHHPIMLHRAILGSFERFIGILIENYNGKFPLWLAPVQAVLTPISDDFTKYIMPIYDKFKQAGIRVEKDTRSETIGYKIKDHISKKVPIILIIGEKEIKTKTISIRENNKTKQMAINSAIEYIKTAAKIPE